MPAQVDLFLDRNQRRVDVRLKNLDVGAHRHLKVDARALGHVARRVARLVDHDDQLAAAWHDRRSRLRTDFSSNEYRV